MKRYVYIRAGELNIVSHNLYFVLNHIPIIMGLFVDTSFVSLHVCILCIMIVRMDDFHTYNVTYYMPR